MLLCQKLEQGNLILPPKNYIYLNALHLNHTASCRDNVFYNIPRWGECIVHHVYYML